MTPYSKLMRLSKDDKRCALTILSDGSDMDSWEQVWEQAVAIVAMCGRLGKEGKATRLGEYI